MDNTDYLQRNTFKQAPRSVRQRHDTEHITRCIVLYNIHTILTDNGIQFADTKKTRTGPTAMSRGHSFDRTCRKYGIEHRLTRPHHP